MEETNMLGLLDFKEMLVAIPTTLIALTGHELAHAFVSYKLGDPTPEYEGRLSFNPLAHLDPFGAIMMALTGFGWAKPVGINPNYYKNKKLGIALVSIAGPLANFLMALIAALIMVLIYAFQGSLNPGIGTSVINILYLFMHLNISLMVFNLIPIPPLDGSKVVGMFLPDNVYYKVLQYERYCMFLIMFLSFSGALSAVLGGGRMLVLHWIQNIAEIILSPILALI